MKEINRQAAIAIIQARTSSTRLPGKVLKPLAGKPMIWHIVERARACRLVDCVVVATSVESSDDALAHYCSENEIDCYRGSLNDVLSRYLEVIDQDPHDYFVRITGDCPLIHPEFIDRQIASISMHDGDMIRCDSSSTLLEGQGVHSSRSLRQVAERSSHPDDREHVGSRYFAEQPDEFRIVGLGLPAHLQDNRWRLTVDEDADYQLMARIYEALYGGSPIPIEKVVRWLEKHPEEAALNRFVEHSQVNKELKHARNTMPIVLRADIAWEDVANI